MVGSRRRSEDADLDVQVLLRILPDLGDQAAQLATVWFMFSYNCLSLQQLPDGAFAGIQRRGQASRAAAIMLLSRS